MDTQRLGLVNVQPGVRLILLQFSFSNPEVVPHSVCQLGRELGAERRMRENLPAGKLVIEPHEDVGLAGFVMQLRTNGYELVDAFHQLRDDQRNPRRTYQMVRYVFMRREHVCSTASFVQVRATLLNGLLDLLVQALWRCRVYLNPLFVDGCRVVGESAVSINLDARKSLFSCGQRIAVWRRDENGEKMGEAPMPIQLAYELRFRDNAIEIVPATAPVSA